MRHEPVKLAACTAALSLLLTPLTPAQDGWGRPEPRPAADEEFVDQLMATIGELRNEVAEWRAEVARLRLELKAVQAERDELRQFISDFEQYGTAFEQYQAFRQERERDERAKRAEEARRRAEERRRRQEEIRDQRRAEREAEQTGDPLERRAEQLRQAGFVRVGEAVFVGSMGYSYRTETNEEIRYSPWLKFWYVDKDTEVDWTELTLSGNVVHAADDVSDLGLAIAFFDQRGAQVGQTTVHIDGARPGVVYPFTSTVQMAANRPFENYSAWVLYLEPAATPAGMP